MFLFLSCEGDDLIFNNPCDINNNVDIIFPDTFIEDDLDQSIWEYKNITISWYGTTLESEYRYNFNTAGWSDWTNETSVDFNDLSNGNYTILVQSKNTNCSELIDPTPALAVFEIILCDIPPGTCDCEGNPFDECGVCDGPGAIYECGCWDVLSGYCDCNANVEDCAGVCGGTALADDCGVCDNNPNNDCVKDCAGIWGGDAYIDNCDNCVGGITDNEPCTQDCFGVWGGVAVEDCAGVCGGSAEVDDCGDCNGTVEDCQCLGVSCDAYCSGNYLYSSNGCSNGDCNFYYDEYCSNGCSNGSCDESCPGGQIEDCNGNCAPESWLGDGYCDDGQYSFGGTAIYLNCSANNWDDGDCSSGGGSSGGGSSGGGSGSSFYEDFSSLSDWYNVSGWVTTTSYRCVENSNGSNGTCAYFYLPNNSNNPAPTMERDVSVSAGQTLSYYYYSDWGSCTLYLNDTYHSSCGNSSIAITQTGNLNIKFVGSTGALTRAWIDDLRIE